MKTEKITIGYSDYSREEMESGKAYNGIGTISEEYLQSICEFEKVGYKVNFESSILRRLFGYAKYKVVATKLTRK